MDPGWELAEFWENASAVEQWHRDIYTQPEIGISLMRSWLGNCFQVETFAATVSAQMAYYSACRLITFCIFSRYVCNYRLEQKKLDPKSVRVYTSSWWWWWRILLRDAQEWCICRFMLNSFCVLCVMQTHILAVVWWCWKTCIPNHLCLYEFVDDKQLQNAAFWKALGGATCHCATGIKRLR